MDGADYYSVYRNDLPLDACDSLTCRKVASHLVESTYLYTSPGSKANYYWITACNSDGCSELSRTAEFVDKRPSGPTNVQYTYIDTENKTRITWAAVEGSDYYNVYWEDFFDDCEIGLFGTPDTSINCKFLEENVIDTYVDDPGQPEDDYWVSACNRSGCSAPARGIRL